MHFDIFLSLERNRPINIPSRTTGSKIRDRFARTHCYSWSWSFFFFFQVECSKVVHGFRDIHGTNSNCGRVVATCLHASRIRDYKPWSEPVSRRNRRNDTFNTGWNTELGAYWRGSKQFSRWVVWREKGEGEGRGEEKERSEPNWKLLSRDFPSGPRTIDAKVVVSTRESRAKWKKTPIGATNKVIARCSPE